MKFWADTDAKRIRALEQRSQDQGINLVEQRTRLEKLELLVEETQAQLKKLRGQFFAERKGARDDPGDDPVRTQLRAEGQQMSREQLKRSLVQSGRFIPGKPPVHGE